MKEGFFIFFIFISSVFAQSETNYEFDKRYKEIYDKMAYSDYEGVLKEIQEFETNASGGIESYRTGQANALYGLYHLIMKSDYINAYEYFIKALRIYEKENLTNDITNIKIQLGLINYNLKNADQAIEEFKVAYNLAKDENKRRAAIAVYLMAHTFIELNKIYEAEEKLDIALNLYSEINDEQGIAECSFTSGIIDIEKGNYESAIEKLNVYMAREKTTTYGVALLSPYLAKAHYLKNDLKKARSIAENSLKISREIKKPNWELSALEVYRDILYAQKDYKKSAEISQEYQVLKDSIYNSNRLYKTAVMKFHYDTERKEIEDAIITAQKEEIQKAALGRQKLLTNVFLAISIVVLLLVLGIFHQYKLKNDKNKELAIALLDLRKTQEQLVVKEKLASLGQLTAGIAHEIQNPLNFVNNFSQLSLEIADEAEQVKDVEEAKEYIKNIKENLTKVSFHGNRVSSIIKSMLQHSRKSTQEKVETDINKFVEDFVNIAITGKKASNIDLVYEVTYSLTPNLPLVHIVQQDLGRVLVNIFNNAFDAIMEKKKVLNGTYKPSIDVSTGIINNYIYIDIKDNGKGIPEEYKKKIFEPFFTTKATGAGTGLGLSITNELLTSHGGSLKVDSTAGEGSTFRILLPLS